MTFAKSLNIRGEKMKSILQAVKDQLPKDIEGFSCIKTQEILIPYLDIGIECLVRDISEINLFFETILKLVEIEVKNISEISYLLGVSEEAIKEVVVDMVSGDYIGVSENNLKVTKKGKEALASKKMITIKKKNLSKVAINLITGEIHDGAALKTVSGNKSSVCLPEVVNVNKQFLDVNYALINNVFQTQQENDSVYGRQGITKELYKIVSIYYRNLVYTKNQMFIYKSRTSDDLQILFATDNADKYVNCFYAQLKSITPPCLENLFERSRDFIDKTSTKTFEVDTDSVEATEKIRNELKNKDAIGDVDLSIFTTKRYGLYDKEYISYFTCSDDLSFSKLIICTNRVEGILNMQIAHELERISQEKAVFIFYDKNEYHASESINHYFGKTTSKNLYTSPCDDIVKNLIFFDQSLIIEVEEQVVQAFGRALSFITSIIDFNQSTQLVLLEDLKSRCDTLLTNATSARSKSEHR